MENPGLKRHSSPPPMTAPKTLNIGGYGAPPEPPTKTEDVETAPPLSGRHSPNPVSVENGDQGHHDVFGLDTVYPSKAHGLPSTRVAGASETQIPGESRQHLPVDPQIVSDDAAEHRRIQRQKQVDGGSFENPAYDAAQDRIREKMQQRRAHPLHQGAFDLDRKEWLYDIDSPDYYLRDSAPSRNSNSAQEMLKLKRIYDGTEENAPDILDAEYNHPGWPACQGCIDADMDSRHPQDKIHFPETSRDMRAHEHQPVEDLPPGVRLAAFDPERGEWLYDIDKPNYWMKDPAPSAESYSVQPMFKLKKLWDGSDGEGGDVFDTPYHHLSYPPCGVCVLRSPMDDPYPPGEGPHDPRAGDHEYSPLEELPPGVRLAAGPGDELHDQFDMMAFEHGMPADPLADMPGPLIHSVDPRSPQYDTDYERGWKYSGQEGANLDVLDEANVSHATYDGYMDYAVGRNKHHYRAVRRLGLDNPEDLPDEHWDHPEKVASVQRHGSGDKLHKFFDREVDGRRHVMYGEVRPDDAYIVHHWVQSPDSTKGQFHRHTSEQEVKDCMSGSWPLSRMSKYATHGPEAQQAMQDVLDIQGSPGNWDYDPYMHGMFNGMELMRAIADDDEPEFRDAPDKYRGERNRLAAIGMLRTATDPDWMTRDELGRFAPKGTRKRDTLKSQPGQFRQAEQELGSQTKALAWDRLRREYPEVKIGPDESYSSHYKRLKDARRKAENKKRPHNRIKHHVGQVDSVQKQRYAAQVSPDVVHDPATGEDVEIPSNWEVRPHVSDPTATPSLDFEDHAGGLHSLEYDSRRKEWRHNHYPMENDDFDEWDSAPRHSGPTSHGEHYSLAEAMGCADVFGDHVGPSDAASWSPSMLHEATQVPNDDPVYPYSGRVDPEDTVDLDNLQEGDDTYRPHHPLVDRVMHHMQGLPDVSRGHPLMEQVNKILDEGDDSPESERGANALAEGLNTIFDSMRETEGMPREEQLQRAKDAIDAHIEAGKISHKEYVRRLHDDWQARGGHKTGEPRPVERFSPRFTRPQRIVPDPNNPYPELESTIYHVGKCEGCGRNLFDSADSSGDPRGALGDHTVGSLDAAEYDATDVPREERTGERRMHGPSALICPSCDSEHEKQERILDRYRGHKAGEMAAGGHWGWPEGADRNDWKARRFIPNRYTKDRPGKWHNPGEKPGECPECDDGIEGFHTRNKLPFKLPGS